MQFRRSPVLNLHTRWLDTFDFAFLFQMLYNPPLVLNRRPRLMFYLASRKEFVIFFFLLFYLKTKHSWYVVGVAAPDGEVMPETDWLKGRRLIVALVQFLLFISWLISRRTLMCFQYKFWEANLNWVGVGRGEVKNKQICVCMLYLEI